VGAFDEAQACQRAHLTTIETGLKVEVKLVERFDPREAGLP
jgi:hypothetical protein